MKLGAYGKLIEDPIFYLQPHSESLQENYFLQIACDSKQTDWFNFWKTIELKLTRDLGLDVL